MTNRLAHETSPYLQQHKDNPVDWFPWGPEALQLAKDSNKPILVSIGYSACHWCHVMAHESFENPQIANYMNQNFVNIKVDREERPDIDSIYMTAVQAMTGQGGWPLNAFLTPAGVPFFGGTYWPPADRMGMPGFPKVLQSVHEAWTTNRESILGNAVQIQEYLQGASESVPEPGELATTIAEDALAAVASQFDREYGGFGNAPKFPQASVIDFLFRHYRRTGSGEALAMALTTLDRMATGGINDQIGGGFARSSVDRTWLVPHFEKMLYDNAQLMSLYLDAWRITGKSAYKEVVEEDARWVITEMTSPEGAFYASLDADSEGVEGKFYVWTAAELEDALLPVFTAEEIDLVKLHYGVTPHGNFEGSTILSVVRPIPELAEHSGKSEDVIGDIVHRAKATLESHRAQRVAPA
ncbi:MAG: thioredoxin domain-containing protein, partial [Thermomicrobiales bacterium]